MCPLFLRSLKLVRSIKCVDIFGCHSLYLVLVGQDARATKNSISAAFSSMFRRKQPSTSSPTSSLHDTPMSEKTLRNITPEARQFALAAVLLEEWLHELAAIAHEQSMLQREQAYKVGIGMEPTVKSLRLPEDSDHNEDSKTGTMVVEVRTENPVVPSNA